MKTDYRLAYPGSSWVTEGCGEGPQRSPMAKISPTQNSLKHLREQGYTADIVERYNSFIHRRFDLFNIIDLIAIKPGEIVGVQSTSYGAATKHRQKIRAEGHLQEWLAAGGRFELHLWRKVKNRWIVKIEEFNQ